MKIFTFDQLPLQVVKSGGFDDTCRMSFSEESIRALVNNRIKINIYKIGDKYKISNFEVIIKSDSGNINIFVGDDDSIIYFGEHTSGNFHLIMWRRSKVIIGKNTTSNGTRIFCDNSEFRCGEDCMFSDNILIQCGDQHGIVNIQSGEIVNNVFKSVVLGDHVWLGRKSIVIGNAEIGNGTIIGAGAVVIKKIPEKVIAAGQPAIIINENYTWCRSPVCLDEFSKQYIFEYCNQENE